MPNVTQTGWRSPVADSACDSVVNPADVISPPALRSPGPHGFGRAIQRGLDVFSGDAVVIMMADESDDCRDVVRTWRNRRTGVAKLKIRKMGSRYFFIVAYVWLEKCFTQDDYRKPATITPAGRTESVAA